MENGEESSRFVGKDNLRSGALIGYTLKMSVLIIGGFAHFIYQHVLLDSRIIGFFDDWFYEITWQVRSVFTRAFFKLG